MKIKEVSSGKASSIEFDASVKSDSGVRLLDL